MAELLADEVQCQHMTPIGRGRYDMCFLTAKLVSSQDLPWPQTIEYDCPIHGRVYHELGDCIDEIDDAPPTP